jgi:hypothetical protein
MEEERTMKDTAVLRELYLCRQYRGGACKGIRAARAMIEAFLFAQGSEVVAPGPEFLKALDRALADAIRKGGEKA